MTQAEVHSFIKHKIGLLLQELSIESGTEIMYNNANLERCAVLLEEYLGLEGIVDEFSAYRMEVDSYE
jgi:hypothetical protein